MSGTSSGREDLQRAELPLREWPWSKLRIRPMNNILIDLPLSL